MLILDPKFPHGLASIALSPCGKWLVAMPEYYPYFDKTPHRGGKRPSFDLKYWSIPQPSKSAKLFPCSRPQSLRFTASGRLLLEEWHEGQLAVSSRDFPTPTTNRALFPAEFGMLVSLSPDDRFAFALHVEWQRNVRKLRLWDTRAGADVSLKRSAFHRGTDHTIPPLMFDPAGERLAAFTLNRATTVAAQRHSVAIWDFPSGKVKQSLQLRGKAVPTGLAFSPCGRWLVGIDADVILVWDSGTLEHIARRVPKLVTKSSGRGTSLFSPTFSPDGRFLAVGGFDGTVRLFDTQNWIEARVFDWGKQLAGADESRRGNTPVTHVAFTPDGAMGIAAVGNNIVLWDME